MLATLAMFVTGVAVLVVGRRRSTGDVMRVDTVVLAHDMRYFAIAYAIAIGAAFLPVDPTWLSGSWRRPDRASTPGTSRATSRPIPTSMPRIWRRCASTASTAAHHRRDPAVPRLRVVNLQVLVALGLIVAGAIFFVDAVEHIADDLHVDGALLALVIAPIATELPEKFNWVIWVRQGKDTLAMGNITGAMVFQATIPTVVALLFAPTPGS